MHSIHYKIHICTALVRSVSCIDISGTLAVVVFTWLINMSSFLIKNQALVRDKVLSKSCQVVDVILILYKPLAYSMNSKNMSKNMIRLSHAFQIECRIMFASVIWSWMKFPY